MDSFGIEYLITIIAYEADEWKKSRNNDELLIHMKRNRRRKELIATEYHKPKMTSLGSVITVVQATGLKMMSITNCEKQLAYKLTNPAYEADE